MCSRYFLAVIADTHPALSEAMYSYEATYTHPFLSIFNDNII